MTKTIMIVDDSASVRLLASYSLREAGFSVIEAKNGLEALDTLRDERIDLLITDMNMPDLDGLGLIKKVRENDREIPILILTTSTEKGKKLEGQASGASAWLSKPFTASQIREVASRLIV